MSKPSRRPGREEIKEIKRKKKPSNDSCVSSSSKPG